MNAGKLNKLLTLQRPRSGSDVDQMGQPEDEWPGVAQMWAEIKPKSSSKVFQGQQSKALATHTITIRWRADVLSNMRFEYVDSLLGRTRHFVIDGNPIDPDERGEFLVCQCTEAEVHP